MIRYFENLTYKSTHENAIDEADYEGCINVVVNKLLALFPSYLIDSGWIEKGATGGDSDSRCRRLKVTLTSDSNLFLRLGKGYGFGSIIVDLFVGNTGFVYNSNNSLSFHAGFPLSKAGNICTILFLAYDISTGFVIGQPKEKKCLCVTKTNIANHLFCYCTSSYVTKMYPDVVEATKFIIPNNISNTNLGCLVLTNVIYGLTKLTNVHVCGYKTNIGAGEMFKVGNTNFLLLSENSSQPVNVCISDEQLLIQDGGVAVEFTAYEKNKLSGIDAGANYYQHPDTHNASMIEVDNDRQFVTMSERLKLSDVAEKATRTEASEINGNIKINGVETQVYELPTITKSDVGLENVDNTADVDKPISYAVINKFNKFVGIKKTTGFSINNIATITSGEIEVNTEIDTFTISGGSRLHDDSILKPDAKGFMCKLTLNNETMEIKQDDETLELGYLYGYSMSYEDTLNVTPDTATIIRNTKTYTFTGLETIELAESGSEFTVRYLVTLPFNMIESTVRLGISRADVGYSQYYTVEPEKGYVCNINQSNVLNKINFIIASSNNNLNTIDKFQTWLQNANLTVRVPVEEEITELTRESVKNLKIVAGEDNVLMTDIDNIAEYSTFQFVLYGRIGELERKIVSKNTVYHAASADTATVAETAKALTEAREIAIKGAVEGKVSFKGDQNVSITANRKGCLCGQRGEANSSRQWFKVASVTLNANYQDYKTIFLVATTFGEERFGILSMRTRRNTTTTDPDMSLKWLVNNNSLDTSEFETVHYRDSNSNSVFELWVKAASSYKTFSFSVLLESTRTALENSVVLYDSKANGEVIESGLATAELVVPTGGIHISSIGINQIVISQNGTSVNRPKTPVIGQQFLDTTLNKVIVYNGTVWVDAMGTTV